MPFTQQTVSNETSLDFIDVEGNEVHVHTNGDAARYGAFLEVDASAGAAAVTAHMTPEQMADLGRWLLARTGLL